MSALSNHLAEQQDTAVRIQGMLEGLVRLLSEQSSLPEYVIARTAYDLARNLSQNLDIVSLPEGDAA